MRCSRAFAALPAVGSVSVAQRASVRASVAQRGLVQSCQRQELLATKPLGRIVLAGNSHGQKLFAPARARSIQILSGTAHPRRTLLLALSPRSLPDCRQQESAAWVVVRQIHVGRGMAGGTNCFIDLAGAWAALNGLHLVLQSTDLLCLLEQLLLLPLLLELR